MTARPFRLRCAILPMLAALLVLPACMTPDKLMGKTATRGTPDEAKAVDDLIAVAADRKEELSLRQWALKALSRLSRVPSKPLAQVGQMVADPGEHAHLRPWAAYALGEWRRKESIPYFAQALSGKVDAVTGYFVLEGLAKVLPSITEDVEINQKVVEAMTAFAAGQTEFTPSMYHLVNEYVATLTVLVLALDRTLAEPRNPAAMRTEIYAAVHRVLAAVDAGKEKYLAAYEANDRNLRAAFERSLDAVRIQYRPLYLLLAWYGGKLGDNRELSGLCAERLGSWTSVQDPNLHLVLAWALSRMEVHAQDANRSLVEVLLNTETDPQVLRLLGTLANEPGKPDELQLVLRIQQLSAAGAGK